MHIAVEKHRVLEPKKIINSINIKTVKRILLSLCTIALALQTIAQTDPHNYSVGTNILDINSFSPQIVFKDLMKHAQEWSMKNPITFVLIKNSDGSLKNAPNSVLRSSDGYPLQVPFTESGQQVIAQTIILDGGPHPLQTGEYELSFEGAGEVNVGSTGVSLGTGETSLSSTNAADKIRFAYNDSNGDGQIVVSIVSSIAANPIRNIQIIPVQFLTDFQTQPFHPRFLEFLNPFSVIRFMDYMRTNNSSIVNFSERCPKKFYTYTTNRGAPYEMMIKLCNQTGKDLWACIPHKANDNFVSSFATLLRDSLNANRKIFIEYSNEVWNPQFDALQFVTQEGKNLFGGVNSTISLGDTTPNGRALQFFAKRNCDVYSIFNTVFGTQMQSRVTKVMGAQASNANTSSYPLSIMRSNNFSTNNQKPDVIAIAPYLAADNGNVVPPNTTLSVSTILDSLQGQIASFLIPATRAHKAIANEFEIDLVTYEGGQHLIPNSANITKFTNVMRNARMKTIYCNMLNAWKQESGGLFMHFSSFFRISVFGCWGAVESMSEDYLTQPKYKALVECGAPEITPANCFVNATLAAPNGNDICSGSKTLQITTKPSPCSNCTIQWFKNNISAPSLGNTSSITTDVVGKYKANVTFTCSNGTLKTITTNEIELKKNVVLEFRLEGAQPQVLATPNELINLVPNPDLAIPTTGTRERFLIINNGSGTPMFNGVAITDQTNTDSTNNFFESGFLVHARRSGSYTLQTSTPTCGIVNTQAIVLTGGVNTCPSITITKNANSPQFLKVTGTTFLQVNNIAGAVYEWKLNNVIQTASTTNSLTITQTGTYTVKAKNACNNVSNEVTFIIEQCPNAVAAFNQFSTPLPICINGSINFCATNNATDSYVWKVNNVLITTPVNNCITATQVGKYSVTATNVCLNKVTIDTTVTRQGIQTGDLAVLTPTQITALGSKRRIPNYTENTTNASFSLDTIPTDTLTIIAGQVVRLDVKLMKGTAFPNNLIPVLSGGSTTVAKLKAQASKTLSFTTVVNSPNFIWKKNGVVQTAITGSGKNITAAGKYEVTVVLPCGSVTTNRIVVKQ